MPGGELSPEIFFELITEILNKLQIEKRKNRKWTFFKKPKTIPNLAWISNKFKTQNIQSRILVRFHLLEIKN